MIFSSQNEKGEPAWKLVLEGRKTVTRRLPKPECKKHGKRKNAFCHACLEAGDAPVLVGQEFAVQPNRGKKAVCRARVVSCMTHKAWETSQFQGVSFLDVKHISERLDEAHREGFASWAGLLKWFEKKGIPIERTHRIEFEVI